MTKNLLKFSVLALSIAGTVAHATCPITSNYFVGGLLGVERSAAKRKMGAVISITEFKKMAKDAGDSPDEYDFEYAKSIKNKNGFLGGLETGFLYRFENSSLCAGFSVAAVFGGGSSKLGYTKSVLENKKDVEKNATLMVRDRGHGKAVFKFGVAVSSFLPFIQFGVATHRMSYKLDDAKSTRKWDNRVVLGAGFDYQVSQNMMLGFLFESHVGATKNPNLAVPKKSVFTNRAQVRNSSQLYMLTAKYLFPKK